jgi:hypothetical protein
MRYLALIYLDERELATIPPREASDLNARHLDLNDRLRASGNFIVAEALAPAQETRRVSKRNGATHVIDGPFTEAKEVVAGFYLIEADTLDQAIEIVSNIPSVNLGTIEVRPCRQLIVDGRPPRWG